MIRRIRGILGLLLLRLEIIAFFPTLDNREAAGIPLHGNFGKPGSRPAGSWFVTTQNLSNWHIAFLKNDIINVKNGPGEEFYYESWDSLKDAAYRVD